MPCGWEGNRRSGVALAMSQTSVVYPATGSRPRQGDEHPAYAHGARLSFTFTMSDATSRYLHCCPVVKVVMCSRGGG